MSRIGKMPVEIPAGVTVTLNGAQIKVKGPKGELEMSAHPNMSVAQEDKQVVVSRPNDQKSNRALHGMTRSLIQNMVIGVTEGYKKTLQLVGVGYKADMKGKTLVLTVGFSHPVLFVAAEGVAVSVLPKENKIVIEGLDKQAVGEAAVRIRKVRPPEPYKGKGIKYEGEIIQRKAGKAAGA